MEPIFALSIRLPERGSRELLRALHAQLKAAILDGRLQAGLRLPATRSLAQALRVSRNTVIAAYDQLLSEGYLSARTGAGTFVADVLPRAARSAAPERAGTEAVATGADGAVVVPSLALCARRSRRYSSTPPGKCRNAPSRIAYCWSVTRSSR